jgi:hypothetical protein
VPFRENDLPVVLRLLEETATRREAEQLLRSRNLPYSALNWETFRTDRLAPAIQAKQVTVDHLADLVAEAEEHGRQHVLLYRATKQAASDAIDENRVRQRLQQLDLPRVLDHPRVLDMPDTPTWVQARVERTPNGQPKALVMKQVMTRETRTCLNERRTGNRLRINYRVEVARAVNVVKLHADGLCEVRVQSHRAEIGQRRKDYVGAATRLLTPLNGLLPVSQFQPVSLSPAKNKIFEQRATLTDVRFTNSTLKNDHGYTISAAANTEAGNLFQDQGTSSGLDAFYKHEAYCDSSNVWFKVGEKPGKDPKAPKEPIWVHLLLSGKANEFAFTAQVSMKEYEHVLQRLRSFNK